MKTPGFEDWDSLFETPKDELPQPQSVTPNYPDVGEHYASIWLRSDTEAAANEEWQTLLNNAETALRHAADVVASLRAREKPMTPTAQNRYRVELVRAIHRTEDLVMEMLLRYPLPRKHPLICTGEDEQFCPKVLFKSNSRVIVWLPFVPARSQKFSSKEIILSELHSVLRDADLPSIPSWHCDFMNIYHSEKVGGILDVDNFDWKPIIDTIARAMKTPDGFNRFSCSMYDFVSDQLKIGCYIQISKRDEKIPFFRDFEKFIRSLENAK